MVEVVLLVVAALLIVLGALQLVVRWRSPDTAQVSGSRGAAFGTGLASGFTTMTANAAGPIMTRYLVAQGVEKRRFLGTSSLFFFGVNLCKISVSARPGLFSASTVHRPPSSARRRSSPSSCSAPGRACTAHGSRARSVSTRPCSPRRSCRRSSSWSADTIGHHTPVAYSIDVMIGER